MARDSFKSASINKAEHVSTTDGENIDAKRVANYVWNGSGWERSAASGSSAYKVNDIDDTTATEYYGKTDASGNWYIQKVTSSAVSHATVFNNSGVIGYATAWSTRASLTYGRYDEAF